MRSIFCIQRSAPKKVVDEASLAESNLAGFSDQIGQTTNKITSMYTVRAHFDKDTREYNTLNYRIASGQLYQQNCIRNCASAR